MRNPLSHSVILACMAWHVCGWDQLQNDFLGGSYPILPLFVLTLYIVLQSVIRYVMTGSELHADWWNSGKISAMHSDVIDVYTGDNRTAADPM